MSEPKRTLDLARAAGCEDNDDCGRRTLDEGGLTKAQVAELANIYKREIAGTGDVAPTERLSEKEIQAALELAASVRTGTADAGGHEFDTNTQPDGTAESALPDSGYCKYLKVGGVALLAVVGLCAYFRTEIAELVGCQKFMDDLVEPEKLSPEKFQKILDQQLDQHPELGSLKENKGLNRLLQKLQLDLCDDGFVTPIEPADNDMLSSYGLSFPEAASDCKIGSNLFLHMGSKGVSFKFEGKKISSMVAKDDTICTVDLNEMLLISCPARDGGLDDFRVYVGEESCVQKMIVGDNAYTYTMSDEQCVKVDVSGWTEVPETPAKAVEPLKNNKQNKQGSGVKAKVGSTEPKVVKQNGGVLDENAVCSQISKHKLLKDVKLPPDFGSRCSSRLKTANDCQAAAKEYCGPDRLGILICRVGVEEKCKKIFHEINPILPR